jgi:ribonuclease T2
VPIAAAKKHHRHPRRFDHYVLALSWAPNYCASHPTDHSTECQTRGHKAFVLHGLWPQANNAPPPMSCAPARPVAQSIVDHMLQLMPTRALIKHEWAKHGTCSGLSAQDYFARVEQAFRKVQVPSEYETLSSQKEFGVKDVEQSFATTNHAPQQAFRVSCNAGDLTNLEVCLNKDLEYQSCTSSVHECSSGQVRVRPPR